MKRVHVTQGDFIEKYGYFDNEVKDQGGGMFDLAAFGNKGHYIIFGHKMCGFVFEIDKFALLEWEKEYLTQMVYEGVSCFVIRYWREKNIFSLAEFDVVELSPFVSGSLKKVVVEIKEYMV